MKRGNLVLSLFLISILFISGCAELGPRDKRINAENTISFAETIGKPAISCFNSGKVDIKKVNSCLEKSHKSFERIGLFNNRESMEH